MTNMLFILNTKMISRRSDRSFCLPPVWSHLSPLCKVSPLMFNSNVCLMFVVCFQSLYLFIDWFLNNFVVCSESLFIHIEWLLNIESFTCVTVFIFYNLLILKVLFLTRPIEKYIYLYVLTILSIASIVYFSTKSWTATS